MTDLVDRAVLSIVRYRNLDRLAVRALLKANELLGLALGVRLAKLRDSDDRFAALFAESEANAFQARLYSELASILAERWDRVPDRRRPHYRPHQRYRILRFRELLGLSVREIAERVRVSPATILRWEQETLAKPGPETVGSLVQPRPPVRRYADVVRQLVHSMALAGFGGCQSIADTLARAGWKLSKRTVSRVLREPRPPELAPLSPSSAGRNVVARHPCHLFMCDLTEVSSLFRLFRFKLAVVLDVFSRFPLAFRLFHTEPSSAQMIQLLERAIRRFGAPRYFVSDQGPQFTAENFREALKRHGIRQRFGAIGKTGSIAIIERFWRTLKHQLSLQVFPPLVLGQLEGRLETCLLHYTFFRPHRSLGRRTPGEVFFAFETKPLISLPPADGQPGAAAGDRPFRLDHLDAERKLTVLKKAS